MRRRFRRFNRRAVSTMIGGIIVLSLFLTALTAMVVVSQQNDYYQTIVDKMSQKDIDRFSENLIANYPGLNPPTQGVTCTGSPTSTCNQYDMTLSNVGGLSNAGSVGGTLGGTAGSGGGGVSLQIVRIYVNSTTGSTGCSLPTPPATTPAYSPCVLLPDSAWFSPTPPTPKAYTFRATDALLNPGEFNHTLRFWLPCVTSCSTSTNIFLPGGTGTIPLNSIWIITARGRTFSFQWPFPQSGPASSSIAANIFTGVMKIAWTSTSGSGTLSSQSDTCHAETKEKLSGPSGYHAGGNLYFVNPWITDSLLADAPDTINLFIYAKFTNPFNYQIQISTGNLIMQVASSGSNAKQFFIGGPLVGVVYPYPTGGTFTPAGTAVTVGANQEAVLVYIVLYTVFGSGNGSIGSSSSPAPIQFSGLAAITNNLVGKSHTTGYFAASILLDGLYDAGTSSTNSQLTGC